MLLNVLDTVAVIPGVVAPGARLRRRMLCSALPRLVAYTLAEAAVPVVTGAGHVDAQGAVVKPRAEAAPSGVHGKKDDMAPGLGALPDQPLLCVTGLRRARGGALCGAQRFWRNGRRSPMVLQAALALRLAAARG